MKKKLSFEQSMERLEEIAALLEQGNAPLEEALKLYEEGTSLAADCSRRLNQAQLKITELIESGEDLDILCGVPLCDMEEEEDDG